MIKINFKQPKYIFPLVIFVPLCALVYFVMQTFSGGEETAGTVATDRINMELPRRRGCLHSRKRYWRRRTEEGGTGTRVQRGGTEPS